jgi:hypothetical protein
MKALDDMKGLALALAFAVLGCCAATSVGVAAVPIASPLQAPVIQVDWQYPLSLPPRFRNHCAIDTFSGLRIRLSILLLLACVFRLLPYRIRLLRLERTIALSSVTANEVHAGRPQSVG